MVGINRLKDSMKSTHPQAKNPLILRYHRLMDAFAKSDDERDFYLDKVEGFLLYVDLDKGIEELDALEKEFPRIYLRSLGRTGKMAALLSRKVSNSNHRMAETKRDPICI